MKSEQPLPEAFEDALAELEEIRQELEDGGQPLAESLARFERGVRLVAHCRTVLEEARTCVEQYVRTDEDGQWVLKPLDHQATDRRRSPGRRKANGQPAEEGLF